MREYTQMDLFENETEAVRLQRELEDIQYMMSKARSNDKFDRLSELYFDKCDEIRKAK